MCSTETVDVLSWPAITDRYAALAGETLTAATVPEWLERWSDLEKAILELWTWLKRPAYRDTTNQVAVEAYQAFTQEMFSTHKSLTESLARKLLDVPDFHPASHQVQFVRRLRNEADLFRAENMPLHAEIIALDYAYREMPKETARASDDYAARWLSAREAVNTLVMRLLTLRRQLARNAGLPDYRAYRWRELARLDYTPEACEALIAAIESEVVPIVQRFAGRYSSVRTPPITETVALEMGVERLLTRVDPEIGALFGRLHDGYLDLGQRPGKAGATKRGFSRRPVCLTSM